MLGVPQPQRLPVESGLEKAKGVLKIEAPDVCPPKKRKVGYSGTSPPEPEGTRLACFPGQFGDLEENERPSNHRLGLTGSTTWVVLCPCMQVALGADAHVPVALIAFGVFEARCTPDRGIIANELRSVSRGSTN